MKILAALSTVWLVFCVSFATVLYSTGYKHMDQAVTFTWVIDRVLAYTFIAAFCPLVVVWGIWLVIRYYKPVEPKGGTRQDIGRVSEGA